MTTLLPTQTTPKLRRTRKPPVAKSLLDSSVSFMTRAIDTHNQVDVPHRYEKIGMDIITAWEKAMKAHLYKKKAKLKGADGKSINFYECLSRTVGKVGSSFEATRQTLIALYNYRNEAQHFYGEDMDGVLLGLASESVKQYRVFLEQHCGRTFLKGQNLLTLPLGGRFPVKPEDFLSGLSASQNASREVKEFLKQLSDAGAALSTAGNKDSILVQFHIALQSTNRVAGADIVVGVDNSKPQEATMSIIRPVAGPLRLSQDQNAATVKISDDGLYGAGWNISYSQIQDFMRTRVPHQKMNKDFLKVYNALKADPNICYVRLLNPGNPRGGKKELFNDMIFQALIDAFPEPAASKPNEAA